MSAPSLFIAVPLLFGVLAGALLGAPAGTAGMLAVLWIACGVLAFSRGPAAGRTRSVGTLLLAGAGFAAAGALLGAAAERAASQPALLTWWRAHDQDRAAHLLGVLRQDAAATQTGVSVTLDVTRADGAAVAGGVRLTVAGGLAAAASPQWRAGRTLAVDAQLREPLDYRDPGVPSDRARLARQGICLVGTVKSAALVAIAADGGVFSEAAARLRAFVRAATADAIGRWSPVSAGVVTAILIGDRSGLPAEDERRLQEAGTYHVIAISGGNIALLTALLVAVGRVSRLPPRSTAAAAAGLLAFYGYAAGLAPSVLRATVGGMIYLAARAVDHRGAALNAVGVAAVVACATDPLSVLDPGFILSFGATFAIIVAVGRLAPRHARHDAGPRRPLAVRLMRVAAVALAGLGAATLCAEVALAPVGARLFGRVSFAGLLLNFAAIPLMSIIQVAGLAAVALAHVWPAAAAVPGWVAHIATMALLRSAALVDAAPWLVLDVPAPAWWVTAGWYAGWGGWLVPRRRTTRFAGAALAGIAAWLLFTAPPFARATRVPPPAPGWTRVVVLDVGQGDATLIQPAGQPPLLVDAGGVAGSAFDLGRRVTLPALWAFGVERLSTLVLTHGDPDHIGGAPPLLRALAPVAVWEGVPVPRHEPLRLLRAAAARASVRWRERRAGDAATAGGLRLRVLNPPPAEWERQRVRNDDSIVLEARIGGVAILLPGDITQAVEREVAARFEPAPLVVVKAPHHGSGGSSSIPFVAALRPAIALISAGARNPFGHPAPAVVARYRAAGARVFNTAEDGAIVIDTDGERVVVWCPATHKREVFAVRER